MNQKLSDNLRLIYNLELALGNVVVRVFDPPHVALPLIIVFKEPLHRAKIESAVKIVPPIEWHTSADFSGYTTMDTLQSLQGPSPPIAELAQEARQKLAPNLRPIYDLELALHNTVVYVEEPAGCPLKITFRNQLHKIEIESTLALPPTVKWEENHDPHYAIQGSYRCKETNHAISGPLPDR